MSELNRLKESNVDAGASDETREALTRVIREQAYYSLIDSKAFVLISVGKDGQSLQFDVLMPGVGKKQSDDTVLKFLNTATDVWREGQAQQESMNGEEKRSQGEEPRHLDG